MRRCQHWQRCTDDKRTDTATALNVFNWKNTLNFVSSHPSSSLSASETSARSSGEEKKEEVSVDKTWARCLVLFAAALYGTNFASVKIIDELMPVSAACAIRFLFAAVISVPLMLILNKDEVFNSSSKAVVDDRSSNGNEQASTSSPSWSDIFFTGAEIGVWNVCGYLSQAVGLQHTSASTSAFICSLAVIVVPLLDTLIGKKLKAKTILCGILALIGCGLLESQGTSLADLTATLSSSSSSIAPSVDVESLKKSLSSFPLPDLATMLQPLAFGMGFWRMERAMTKFPTQATLLTCAQLISVAVIATFYCALGFGGQEVPSFDDLKIWISTPKILAALLWTGCVTTGLTVYIETVALGTLSAEETTIIFSTEPLFGAAFAAFAMGEVFGPTAYMGGALILSGCIISNVNLGSIFSVSKGGDEEQQHYQNRNRKDDGFLSSFAGPSSSSKLEGISSLSGGIGLASFIAWLQETVMAQVDSGIMEDVINNVEEVINNVDDIIT
jgi:drug/metabolite transporter (DMT)-like permease